MEVTEVKRHIKQQTLNRCYIFTGEEIGVMRIYINKIAEVMNTTPIEADTVASITSNLTGNSLFKTKNLYVVQDDTDFLKHDEVWNRFIDSDTQTDNVLILVFNLLDKRSKFYKTYKDTIVEFKRLNELILSKYIRNEIALSEDNIYKLIDICENDYLRLFSEIDKIKHYKQSKDVSMDENEAFNVLLNDDAIYVPPRDAIFDFVDAVLRRKIRLAFGLLQESYEIGENTLALLSVLYTNTKQVLQVQSAPKDEDLTKITSMNAYQVQCAKSKVGFYRNGDLVYIMRMIQDIEKRIKTGEIDEAIAVNYLLVSIWT